MYDESHIGNAVYARDYTCPNCGGTETDYDGFCVKCGEWVVDYGEAPAPKPQRSRGPAKMDPRRGGKTTACRTCGRQVAKTAKACPYCGGKISRPFYRQWWFWVLAVVVLFGSCGRGGDQEESAAKASAGTAVSEAPAENQGAAAASAAEQAPAQEGGTEAVKTLYRVGDTLHDGNMDIVYIASGDYTEPSEYFQPKAGNRYIFAKFAFINTSDSRDAAVSFYSFEAYADGYACEKYYGGDEQLSATLSPGRSTEGSIYFEVPNGASEIEIEYNTNFFTSDRITFAYEGNRDSGYVLQKNTQASADALHVGQTVSSSELEIAYLNCFRDTSYPTWSEPRAGYHYVTIELEFTNKGSTDHGVSAFSFDCYADGVSCEPKSFRDDMLSATLSAGRKTKGTVTYEVPDGASVVEFEYLSNYWTSNRVGFDASGI